MAISLSDADRKQVLTSLRRFCDQELAVELSDIQLHALLDFVVKEIGPSMYNGAVAEAQAFLRDRLADLEATCYEPEFPYWPQLTEDFDLVTNLLSQGKTDLPQRYFREALPRFAGHPQAGLLLAGKVRYYVAVGLTPAQFA